METKIKVIFNGQEYFLTRIGYGDLCAFEGEFGVPAMSVFQAGADVLLTHMAYLVLRGLIKQGAIPKGTPFDQDFMDQIDAIEFEDDETKEEDVTDVDPTAPAPLPA